MLSAPVKSAKRISSLFSLGSHKDQASPSSPTFNSSDHIPNERRRRQSTSRLTRHVSTPTALYSEPRTVPSEGIDRLDLEGLPPPPSLSQVNNDFSSSAPTSPVDSRPKSRGRDFSRPSSSAGLAIPRTNTDSRPGTPSKRRSWMPGRSRANSVEKRASMMPMPQLPGAWIAGLDQKIVYDLGPLSRGEQVRPTQKSGTAGWTNSFARLPNCGTNRATPMCTFSPKTPVVQPHSRLIRPFSPSPLPSPTWPAATMPTREP